VPFLAYLPRAPDRPRELARFSLSITIGPSPLERVGMTMGATDIVTILFTDLVRSTDALARGDADRARALLEIALPHARELDLTGVAPEIEGLLTEL